MVAVATNLVDDAERGEEKTDEDCHEAVNLRGVREGYEGHAQWGAECGHTELCGAKGQVSTHASTELGARIRYAREDIVQCEVCVLHQRAHTSRLV